MLRDLNIAVAGRRDSTDHRVGVLASEIPTGHALPAFLLNDVDAGFPNRLYSVEILTLPSAGTLALDKTGAGTFSGAPDGTYSGTQRVGKFDPGVGRVSNETGTYTLQIGTVTIPALAPRFARPVGDVSKGAWLPSTGSDLYAVLDEVTLDATDYISTSSAATCELALGPIVDPGTSAGQVVRYEAHAPGGGNLTVKLKQGATVIATRTHATLPATATVHELVLTTQQCDSITDYRDLRLEFTVN